MLYESIKKDVLKDLQNKNGIIQEVFLMAEDNESDAELVKAMLNETFGDRYSIVCVDRFDLIIDALKKGTFELLILDMNLPDRSGIENISHLERDYPDLPIVVLTGQDDLDLAVEALKKGAQDYLSKNHITPEILSRSLRYAKERKYIERRLKIALEEIAYRNVQLEASTKHDYLSGLPNRSYFHDEASRILFRAERRNSIVGLLYFDLNGFKKINDCYGHLVGDELIKQVSKRLKEVVREADILARLGGDEFVLMTDLLVDREQIYPIIERLKSVFKTPFELNPHEVVLDASIGVAFFPEAGNLDLLLKQADFAMYEAKHDKHVNVYFYTAELAARYARKQDIEYCLREAIESNELLTHFQPLYNVKFPSQFMFEALVRWNSRVLGWVTPDEFIPIAEHTPIINGISRQVIKHSSDLLQTLANFKSGHCRISVNICASQLKNDQFVRMLINWIGDFGLSSNQFCLELTERQIVENSKKCKDQLDQLRHEGFRIALDDFGTGFSSITHLIELPIDELKIDRKLITGIDKNIKNQALIAGIIEMSHRIGLEVVAEGVESKNEFDTLINLNCDFLQGYYIAKPMDKAGVLEFLNC